LSTDADRLREVARLLAEHARRSRRNGAVMPAELAHALLLASGVLQRPDVASTVDAGESLLMDYAAAARALSTSARTVRRYVTDGRLPAVDCGGPRIRQADLVAFVASLPTRTVA
jgi:hypothetical protein